MFSRPWYARAFWDNAVPLRSFEECEAAHDLLPEGPWVWFNAPRALCVRKGVRQPWVRTHDALWLHKDGTWRSPGESPRSEGFRYSIHADRYTPLVSHWRSGAFTLHHMPHDRSEASNYLQVIRRYAPDAWKGAFDIAYTKTGPALVFRTPTSVQDVTFNPQSGTPGAAERAEGIAKFIREHSAYRTVLPLLSVGNVTFTPTSVVTHLGVRKLWSMEGNLVGWPIKRLNTPEYNRMAAGSPKGWAFAGKYSSMFDENTAYALLTDPAQPWAADIPFPSGNRQRYETAMRAESTIVRVYAEHRYKVPADHWVWELAGLLAAMRAEPILKVRRTIAKEATPTLEGPPCIWIPLAPNGEWGKGGVGAMDVNLKIANIKA
jgi:hypothetical protein